MRRRPSEIPKSIVLAVAALAVSAPARAAESPTALAAEGPEEAVASPRELWERLEPTLGPFSFAVERDEVVPSDTDPREKLRRVEVRFASQTVRGNTMNHLATAFIPADPARLQDPRRRGRVVVVGQRLGDDFMLYDYGDPIATRTGYPTMVLPVPGDFDGLDGEGRWMVFFREIVEETRDPLYHNYFRLAVPYLRALDVFAALLGEREIRAVIGGHSKRATSAYTAAAISPERVDGVVYMGNETVFSLAGRSHLRPISPAYSQRYVDCPVLYIGATNEDGYEMFAIGKIQALMTRPWTIEYIPNYRHAASSEKQFADWQMWVAHVFDGRPIAKISDLSHEIRGDGTVFRARVSTPNKIVQVKFWYVYCDDVPYWRDLVWYPTYAPRRDGDLYEAFHDGSTPDAWLVEVKDTAMGFPGYLTSLPQDITGKPTKERISRGWKPRAWTPKPKRPPG